VAAAHDLDGLIENVQPVTQGSVVRLIHCIHSGLGTCAVQ
jgi:hypothetical protein